MLHLSDLHFGPYFLPEVGEAVLASAESLRPDIVIVSGDFTQRAKPQQFADARKFLDRLPRVPLVVTPGNHDVPLYRVFERIFSPFDLYQEHIHAELDYVVRHDWAVVVSLNSATALRAIVNGRLRRRQLDFCRTALANAPAGAARIIVAHHHLAPAPDYEKTQAMPGWRRALDCFGDLQVDLILGGHQHRAYIGNSLDLYAGDRSAGIIIVQSGTSTSRRGRAREREKNSFNVIRVSDELIQITHSMFFSELGGFAPVSHHWFPRAQHGYVRSIPTLTDPS